MKSRVGSNTGYARRYLLALILAALLGLGAAVPVFAQEPGAGDEPEIQPDVVGGTAVPDGKYKFVAVLRDVTRGNSVREQFFCGGTLIDRDSVLTAAHCLEDATPGPLRVTVGRTVLNSDQGQTRSVAAIFRHPRYTTSAVSYRYDAAVLKLGAPIRNIAPIRIPVTTANGYESPGRNATVAGWGNTIKQGPNFSQPDNFPNRMREAQVPIVSDAVGRSTYGSSYAPALMVAAGREGKDTCQGDSGGPIFVSTENGRRQIGITSFGNGCGVRNYPGVYTEANWGGIRNFIYGAARR